MFRNPSFALRAFLVTAVIVDMIALPGCGSKVTAENVARVQVGQTEAEVQAILGEPTSSKRGEVPGWTHADKQAARLFGLYSGVVTKEWKDGDKTISVVFLNGKVGFPGGKSEAIYYKTAQ